jgi:hypothetical protein
MFIVSETKKKGAYQSIKEEVARKTKYLHIYNRLLLVSEKTDSQ